MTDDTLKLQELQVFQREMAKQSFTDACNSVLDRGPSFNLHDLNYLNDKLKKGKNKYLQAIDKKDKKSQSMIMNEISSAEKNWDQIHNLKINSLPTDLISKRSDIHDKSRIIF